MNLEWKLSETSEKVYFLVMLCPFDKNYAKKNITQKTSFSTYKVPNLMQKICNELLISVYVSMVVSRQTCTQSKHNLLNKV